MTDNEKKSEIISDLKHVGFVVAIFITIAICARFCDGSVNKYIGKWEIGHTAIEIEERPGKEIKESLTLHNETAAKLIMPVRVKSLKDTNLRLMVREGIYDVDGKHALIIFCNICKVYVIFGLKRDGDNLLIGIPRYHGYKDRNIHNAMWDHGHTRSMFHYGNMDWVTYKPMKR